MATIIRRSIFGLGGWRFTQPSLVDYLDASSGSTVGWS